MTIHRQCWRLGGTFGARPHATHDPKACMREQLDIRVLIAPVKRISELWRLPSKYLYHWDMTTDLFWGSCGIRAV